VLIEAAKDDDLYRKRRLPSVLAGNDDVLELRINFDSGQLRRASVDIYKLPVFEIHSSLHFSSWNVSVILVRQQLSNLEFSFAGDFRLAAKKSSYQPLSDDAALRAIVEGVESETGERFFSSLVEQLASAFSCQYAFVSEFLDDRLRFRTRAFWGPGGLMKTLEIPMVGTPCEPVLAGKPTHHSANLQRLFRTPAFLKEWGIESYCGVPMYDSSGVVVGHLAILSEEPMWDGPRGLAVMRIFAARATAEIERLRAENELRLSEERLAGVLQSALDAIITFDANRSIVLFNHAAENVFKCSAADTVGRPLDQFLRSRLGELIEEAISSGTGLGPRPFLWARDGVTARRADGEEFPIEATISQVATRSGKFFTLILRDIEARLRTQEAVRELSLQKDYLLEEIREEHNFEEIIGHSQCLVDVIGKVKLVAETDASVLILGESGTGKELVARAVHANSPRRGRALVKVNCAGLPAGLIDSELFGHERGAFTGARERRIGRFELAQGGTIFLDEVGDVPPEVQVKLLRVLQEHEFERLGGSHPIKADVRVIAATNRDLVRAVAEKTFRQDLFYRLNVFPLHVPPLRERPEDIPSLVHYFVRRFNAKIGRQISRVPRETMERLVCYSWPGNVRELENVIERAVILSLGNELEIGSGVLPQATGELVCQDPSPSDSGARSQSALAVHHLEEIRRHEILEVLRHVSWRIEGPGGAAQMLRLKPSTLRSRMRTLGIRRSVQAAP
jgi:formate hydrogenlyase transcriptional activator